MKSTLRVWGIFFLNVSHLLKLKFKPFGIFFANEGYFLLTVVNLLDQSVIIIWCHVSDTISFSLISSSGSYWILLALCQCKINTNYLYICVYIYVCTYIMYVYTHIHILVLSRFFQYVKLCFFNMKLSGANRTVLTTLAVKWSSFHWSIDQISVLQT